MTYMPMWLTSSESSGSFCAPCRWGEGGMGALITSLRMRLASRVSFGWMRRGGADKIHANAAYI